MRKLEEIVIYCEEKFYAAFPSIVSRPDGELLVAFRRAPDRRRFGAPGCTHTDANSYLMLVRSRDLVDWESSPFNPVLYPSEEDINIANRRMTAEKQAYIRNGGRAGQALINNSDIEFVEFNGQVIVGYACGAQTYDYKFIAEGVYDGTEAQFLRGWFPENEVAAN